MPYINATCCLILLLISQTITTICTYELALKFVIVFYMPQHWNIWDLCVSVQFKASKQQADVIPFHLIAIHTVNKLTCMKHNWS